MPRSGGPPQKSWVEPDESGALPDGLAHLEDLRESLGAPPRFESRFRRSEEHTLNSSHSQISYAVFCLKKKKCKQRTIAYYYKIDDGANTNAYRAWSDRDCQFRLNNILAVDRDCTLFPLPAPSSRRFCTVTS